MNAPDNDTRHLLGLLSHELRSPAAVVAGYLRLLLGPTTVPLPARERTMIEEANRSCARLLRVVQDLGDLASLEGPEALPPLSPVHVFSLCDEVVSATNLEGEAQVAFSYADVDRPTVVQGHGGRLKQAFRALVAATLREGGTGSLEGCGFVTHDPGAAHAVVALGREGMAGRRADILRRDVFFDRWRGGTGMSLPIACRIIEAHGGQIWSLDKASGTACAFSLPVARL